MMAAASANTLNQVREVWQDSQMHRTCRRPLPSGRVSRLHAVGLAATLGLGSLGVLATQVILYICPRLSHPLSLLPLLLHRNT